MPKTNEATRFQPKPPEEKMVRVQVYLRPDQVERLKLEPNQSARIRRAIDADLSIHAPDDAATAAAYDKAFEDMKKPLDD